MSRPKRPQISAFWLGLLTLALGVVGSAAWLVWTAIRPTSAIDTDVLRLKTEYPTVEYRPRKPATKRSPAIPSSFTFTIQKSRPPLWTSEREVSSVAKWAIIISEDWAFYQHDGFDAAQIEAAIKTDMKQGRLARGASTITQQVVKNILLSHERSLIRKAREFSLAIQMDRALTKSRILELYLNIAEWGEGVFGIRAASRLYFSKEPSELTAREGAFLAMLLPSPKRYSQSFRSGELTPFARKMIRSILGKMRQAKILTAEEHSAAIYERFPFERTYEPPADTDDGLEPEPEAESPTEVDQNASVE